MKKILTLLALVACIVSIAPAQNDVPSVSYFIPSTLTAGVSMNARALSETYSDTTKGFYSRGYAAVFVGLETATNDTIDPVIVSYRVSKDNSSWGAWAVVDSFNNNGGLGASKYVALPANALGAAYAQVRCYGRVDGAYSGPAATLTTKIIRVLYGTVKQR
jgi:hypothetical protein